MLSHLGALLAGFSIVSCFILLFAYVFFLNDMRKSTGSKFACFCLLGSLIALQIGHYVFFTSQTDLLSSRNYCLILITVPAFFYLFSRFVISPESIHKPVDGLHFLPALFSFLVPTSLIPSIAFLIGMVYTFWFSRIVFKLRQQRSHFKFEIFFFGLFSVIALIALLLGLALPYLDPAIFYTIYSISISICMTLIVSALLVFPDLLIDIALIAESAYAQTKLSGVDVSKMKQQLEQIMSVDKQYQNEALNLTTVANLLGLTGHQLSELINTEYNLSFPRFVRKHRIEAAKEMLENEPNTSILAISLDTGFKSQSSFYAAFNESTGESPGSYRKRKAQF